MRDPEYDRFGPWVLEISNEDPIPPLFVSWMTRDEAPLFSIKIPRPDERRNLEPGMNMYDYVVSLYESDLHVLERNENDVNEQSIPYKDIVAIRHKEDLLDGELNIYIAQRSYSIPYNTVSSEIVCRLADLLRERYIADGSSEAASSGNAGSMEVGDELSFYFNGLLKGARKDQPDMSILATQTEVPVSSIEENLWRRFLYGAIDKRLLESIHMFNGRELQIINRGRTWSYRWQVVYGKETLFLPLEKITGINVEPDPKNPGISTVVFRTAGSSHSFSFTSGNPSFSGYSEFLKQKAV